MVFFIRKYEDGCRFAVVLMGSCTLVKGNLWVWANFSNVTKSPKDLDLDSTR